MTLDRRRAAAWLWIIWAFVAWNLAFDLVIIEAGREYVRVVSRAPAKTNPHLLETSVLGVFGLGVHRAQAE